MKNLRTGSRLTLSPPVAVGQRSLCSLTAYKLQLLIRLFKVLTVRAEQVEACNTFRQAQGEREFRLHRVESVSRACRPQLTAVRDDLELVLYYFLLLMAFLLLGGCSTLVPIPEALPTHTHKAPLAAYAQVLQNYVNERGEVDFPALQKHRTDLDIYVAYVAGYSPNAGDNPHQTLAHYLNSYNALSMYNVLASDIPKTHAGLAKIRFFYLRKLHIGGKEMSLYAYENEVIRKLKEPRVHFALNCSALGCPTLPRTPFTEAGLHQELDREAHKFFSENRNLRIDHANKTVYLSELLDFYTEDFISKATPTLIAYVNQYSPETIPEDYAVEFIPYDWTVANSAR